MERATSPEGTLHTNGAVNTIARLVDAFPAEEQSQIRTTLAESIAGVVSQFLLKTIDGQGRCAAKEILLRAVLDRDAIDGRCGMVLVEVKPSSPWAAYIRQRTRPVFLEGVIERL